METVLGGGEVSDRQTDPDPGGDRGGDGAKVSPVPGQPPEAQLGDPARKEALQPGEAQSVTAPEAQPGDQILPGQSQRPSPQSSSWRCRISSRFALQRRCRVAESLPVLQRRHGVSSIHSDGVFSAGRQRVPGASQGHFDSTVN